MGHWNQQVGSKPHFPHSDRLRSKYLLVLRREREYGMTLEKPSKWFPLSGSIKTRVGAVKKTTPGAKPNLGPKECEQSKPAVKFQLRVIFLIVSMSVSFSLLFRVFCSCMCFFLYVIVFRYFSAGVVFKHLLFYFFRSVPFWLRLFTVFSFFVLFRY